MQICQISLYNCFQNDHFIFMVLTHYVSLYEPPREHYQTFHKVCSQCSMHYRYQETKDGIFNYNDHLLLTYSLLMHIRSALVHHTAINRVVKMLEFRLDIALHHRDIENAFYKKLYTKMISDYRRFQWN